MTSQSAASTGAREVKWIRGREDVFFRFGWAQCMRHYDIAIDSSQIGRARDGPGEDIEHDEGSLKDCAG